MRKTTLNIAATDRLDVSMQHCITVVDCIWMVGGMKGCIGAAAAVIKGSMQAVVDTNRLQRQNRPDSLGPNNF